MHTNTYSLRIGASPRGSKRNHDHPAQRNKDQQEQPIRVRRSEFGAQPVVNGPYIEGVDSWARQGVVRVLDRRIDVLESIVQDGDAIKKRSHQVTRSTLLFYQIIRQHFVRELDL